MPISMAGMKRLNSLRVMSNSKAFVTEDGRPEVFCLSLCLFYEKTTPEL